MTIHRQCPYVYVLEDLTFGVISEGLSLCPDSCSFGVSVRTSLEASERVIRASQFTVEFLPSHQFLNKQPALHGNPLWTDHQLPWFPFHSVQRCCCGF